MAVDVDVVVIVQRVTAFGYDDEGVLNKNKNKIKQISSWLEH